MECESCGRKIRIALSIKQGERGLTHYCLHCIKDGGVKIIETLHSALLSRALSLLQR